MSSSWEWTYCEPIMHLWTWRQMLIVMARLESSFRVESGQLEPAPQVHPPERPRPCKELTRGLSREFEGRPGSNRQQIDNFDESSDKVKAIDLEANPRRKGGRSGAAGTPYWRDESGRCWAIGGPTHGWTIGRTALLMKKPTQGNGGVQKLATAIKRSAVHTIVRIIIETNLVNNLNHIYNHYPTRSCYINVWPYQTDNCLTWILAAASVNLPFLSGR
jgi:hypothetical protein